ncbi:hypothetical protein L1280_002172 [Deinococcus sp. HSC-46F16]|uniref:pilus assembly PilX N-terminal domain-containing protein n=1 Tax=Deinococcus sp. HSC-46F16 TaxID=2910968 RepID=UPI00209CA574|nr:pilus assembly PilX N-terminal domain-containing protein [Deinococcus sp. HSC-46F16]MCP2015020.1 hypothetical protein [Deinococcus sp. HSC-46F16]
MSVHVLRPRRRRREEGIALVVVLLFTAVVLTIVVSTTATLALGARGGGVNERAAYQALLAAESGLNTFEARVRDKTDSLPLAQRLRGTPPTPQQFNAWLQAYGLNTYTTASGRSVTLTFDPAQAPDLALVATEANGNTKKVVLQNYSAYSAPAYNIRADAPLVSYPNVDVKGGARIEGQNGLNSTGMTQVAKVDQPSGVTLAASATAPTFSMNLEATLGARDRMLLAAGDYVSVGSRSYRVQSVREATGTQPRDAEVTLKALGDSFPLITITNSAAVQRIDSAVTASFIQTVNQTTTVPVSDPTFFVVGSDVFLGAMKGRVESIDTLAKTIQVNWLSTSGANSATVTEGTPVRRDVRAVASGYGIDGEDQVTNGVYEDDLRLRNLNPFNPSADTETTDLFTHTFGQTKKQMLNVAPFNVGLTATDPQPWVNPTSGFTGTMPDPPTRPVLIDGSLHLNGSQELCGRGILIVKGNMTVNGTCAAGFQGAIYVMGDYDQQGNSIINGAVIAEGATEIVAGTECVPNPTGDTGSGSGNSCDTQVAGTGQGSGKINYDRGALLAAGSLLSPPTFGAVQGTWRQR